MVGVDLATYVLYKCHKEMTHEKLNETYCQPNYLWIDGLSKREPHKINSVSKIDIMSWLAKQALTQVHITLP